MQENDDEFPFLPQYRTVQQRKALCVNRLNVWSCLWLVKREKRGELEVNRLVFVRQCTQDIVNNNFWKLYLQFCICIVITVYFNGAFDR